MTHAASERSSRFFKALAGGDSEDLPPVHWGHLVVSLLLFPLFFLYWLFFSLGDLLSCAIHLILGFLAVTFACFAGLAGGTPIGAWRAGKRQLFRAVRALLTVLGHFLSCFGFEGTVERVKARFRPQVTAPAAAPAAALPGPDAFPFEDRYRIEARLGRGGSTGRLFVVRRVAGRKPVGDRLVLKYFDLVRGSHLEEVVRESRGMQVAKDLGIVLEHHLERDHFYYVMPYYEGETLAKAAARIHRRHQRDEALPPEDARQCLLWMAELLRLLDGYHRRGVIHKDVKPDNVIVTDEGLRLVDLGLLTSLQSALTLTTHGTEYFRDPEMVRLSLEGVRVRDVDAVRFDVYSAGAVLFLLFEGSFPACGPLSRYKRPVPMAISWITSRAMAEGDKRYPSVAAMRADLEALVAIPPEDLARLPVSRLPSFRGFEGAESVAPPPPPALASVPAAPRFLEPVRISSRPAWRRALVVLAGVVVTIAGIFAIRLIRREAGPASGPSVVASTLPGVVLSPDLVLACFDDWTDDIPLDLRPAGGFRVVLATRESGEVARAVLGARARLRERGIEVEEDLPALAGWLERMGSAGTPDSERSLRVKEALASDARTFVLWLRRIDERRVGDLEAVPVCEVRGYHRTLSFRRLARILEPEKGGGG